MDWPTFFNIIQPIFSTFLGAFFAFGFTFWLYRFKKSKDDEAYLKYSIACFASMTGNLYNLKKQYILPKEEAINFLNSQKEHAYKHIEEMKPLGTKISLVLKSQIDIEKLNFLAKHDPNAIMLLRDAQQTFDHVTVLISECNLAINEFTNKRTGFEFQTLIELNNNLIFILNNAIYLTTKASEILIKACSMYYDDTNVKNIKFTNVTDENLKPKPNESYEGREYFPKKKCLCDFC